MNRRFTRARKVSITCPRAAAEGHYPKTFLLSAMCIYGLPAAKVGIVRAKVAAYLHPAALQLAWGRNEGARHRGRLPPIASQWHSAES